MKKFQTDEKVSNQLPRREQDAFNFTYSGIQGYKLKPPFVNEQI